MNKTFQADETRNRVETLRTLEDVEAKVNYHEEKAKHHRENVSQKFNNHCERIMSQG